MKKTSIYSKWFRILPFLIFCFPFSILAQTTRYVKADATGTNDGTSWANAYTELQAALNAADANDEIWVATGIYKPTQYPTGITPTSERDKTFYLNKDLKIYGGFVGTETMLTQRNYSSNETILSGDFRGDDIFTSYGDTFAIINSAENAYHILICAGLTNAASIDGFTFRGGNGNNDTLMNNISYSGYLYSRAYCGGVYNQSSSLNIKNVIFMGNLANYYSGAMRNVNSSPILTNVLFTHNCAMYGGAITNNSSSPTLTNVILKNNVASVGGALYNEFSNFTLVNVTIANNFACEASAFYSSSGNLNISNSILWNNGAKEVGIGSSFTTYRHCIIKGSFGSTRDWLSSIGHDGGNNLDVDPLFLSENDCRLAANSPAINAGNNTYNSTNRDINGNIRIQNDTIDIGAIEGSINPVRQRYYVKYNASGANNGTSWANAYVHLQDAIDAATKWDEIWVAAGTYKPTGYLGRNNLIDNRDKTFYLYKDVKIYGGFAGTETALSERNIRNNITVLSGDFGNNDVVVGNGSTQNISNNEENAYHVLVCANLTKATVIDGFTIKGGNAPENQLDSIQYLNYYIYRYNGGGLYSLFSAPTLSNLIFSENTANFGGAIFSTKLSTWNIVNSVFARNKAKTFGGAIYNEFASFCELFNVTMVYNNAGEGGAIFTNYGTVTRASNSIIWGNGDIEVSGRELYGTYFRYSIVKGSGGSNAWRGIYGTDSGNNLDIDPLLNYNNFRLTTGSPALNAGNNSYNNTPTDLNGNTRVQNNIIDIGALEGSVEKPNPQRYYVKYNATGMNNGSSWANAFTNLQNAINIATESDEVWVAAGTYKPIQCPIFINSSDNRDKAFYIDKNLKIYGGFIGSETVLTQRNHIYNTTVLSGDFSNDDNVSGSGISLKIRNNAENAYHVLVTKNLSNEAVIDGFTIKGGNSSIDTIIRYILPLNTGGGLLNISSSPSISNINFIANSAIEGGAVTNIFSSPIIKNTVISNNFAKRSSAMSNQVSSPILMDVKIISGLSLDGQVIYNNGSSPTLTNVTIRFNAGNLCVIRNRFHSAPILTNVAIVGNSGDDRDASAINNFWYSSPILTNVTITGNFMNSYSGGLTCFAFSSPEIRNSIIWGNGFNEMGGDMYMNGGSKPIYYNCILKSMYIDGTTQWNNWIGKDGGGNIKSDPLFVSATNPFLQANSPAINAGNNIYNTTERDLAGNIRIKDGVIDIGAYEGYRVLEEDNIRLFPNPVFDILTVQVSSGGTARIANFAGVIVKIVELQEFENQISVADLAPGIYFLQVNQQSIRFVKM